MLEVIKSDKSGREREIERERSGKQEKRAGTVFVFLIHKELHNDSSSHTRQN